jgi:tetratricopeptide (TPR) repeat protein
LKNSHKILFLSVVFFITIGQFISAPVAPAADTSSRQFDFAESLFGEGDYYRSISEYKRFMFYFPNDGRVEKAFFRIGESYYRAKRWTEAIDSMKAFIIRYPQSPMMKEALWLKGLSEKNLKRYDEALSTFQMIADQDSGEWRNRAIYQVALVYVDRGEWDQAHDVFVKIPKGSFLFSSANQFASGLEKVKDLPAKSPVVAGSLAAVLPGAGHLYTERPRDALVAFLLNGAFIVAAVELFRHENYVAGGIVTFFELGWYGGNIYSAVGSAHKYNRQVQDEYIRQLKEKDDVSIQRSHSGVQGKYLMYSFTY